MSGFGVRVFIILAIAAVVVGGGIAYLADAFARDDEREHQDQ